MYHVSVAGVVRSPDGSRILLIQRRDSREWQIPGGLLEQSEDVRAGLLREIIEETGLIVVPRSLSGVYVNVKLGSVALVFLCDVAGGELREVTGETVSCRWYLRSDAIAMCDEMFAERIRDAVDPDSPSAVKTHDGHEVISATFGY